VHWKIFLYLPESLLSLSRQQMWFNFVNRFIHG
jgi:hypothetical protein